MIELVTEELGTQQSRVLAMLSDGPKTTHDFLATTLSAEYRSAISRLRKRGYTIRATRLRNESWLYELGATPE